MSLSLPGYEARAADLAKAYDAVDPASLYHPVARWLPEPGRHVLDIGAGTGRDAAWFAQRGCTVTAVEPVSALWRHPQIRCVNDQLPDLAHLCAMGATYDVTILTGVWHHLSLDARKRAVPVLSGLLKPAGWALLRLRHGPSHPQRPGFAVNPSFEAQTFINHGFKTLFQVPMPSLQAGNTAHHVRWTWLGVAKPAD